MKSSIAAWVGFFFIVVVALIAFWPHEAHSKSKCNVVGLNSKSHPTLKRALCDLSRAFGQVVVTNTRKHKNCRTRNSVIGKKRSWHKYNRGCRAADIRIKGVSNLRIARWWLNYTKRMKGVLGGAHAYKSGFIHLDTRTHGARVW